LALHFIREPRTGRIRPEQRNISGPGGTEIIVSAHSYIESRD